MTDVSIIIPAYNEEDYISKTVLGILDQEFDGNFEIIVVNDHSTDGTLKIVQGICDGNQNVSVISPPQRGGVANARNFGANKAKSKKIAFIDSDCIPKKGWLKSLSSSLDENVMAIGSIRLEKYERISERLYYSFSDLTSPIFKITGIPTCAAGPNCAIKKDVFDKLGGYRDVFLEDVDMVFRAKKMGKIGYEKDMVVFTSPRRFRKQGFIKTTLRIIEAYLRLLVNRPKKSLHSNYFKELAR